MVTQCATKAKLAITMLSREASKIDRLKHELLNGENILNNFKTIDTSLNDINKLI